MWDSDLPQRKAAEALVGLALSCVWHYDKRQQGCNCILPQIPQTLQDQSSLRKNQESGDYKVRWNQISFLGYFCQWDSRGCRVRMSNCYIESS